MHVNSERLRAAREYVELSREQVAVTIGRSYHTICRYESGAQIPPPEIIEHLAELYECELESLYGDDSESIESVEQ